MLGILFKILRTRIAPSTTKSNSGKDSGKSRSLEDGLILLGFDGLIVRLTMDAKECSASCHDIKAHEQRKLVLF